MHLIQELNKKIWYRFLKVLCFLALVLVIGMTLLISWSNAHPPDFATLAQQQGAMPTTFDPTSLPGVTRVPSSPQQSEHSSQWYATLLNDLQKEISNHPNYTLADLANMYAPASDGNDPAQYAANLANYLGVAPDATLGSLEPRIGDLANAVASNEEYEQPGIGAFSAPNGLPAIPSVVSAAPYRSSDTEDIDSFLSDAIPAILIELLLFEIIRRGFYYVVIGKIFPQA